MTPPPRLPLTAAEASGLVAERLALHLVERGFDGGDDVVRLIDAAARRGAVSPVLVDIVADPAAPEPARYRALGRLLRELAAAPARAAAIPAPTAA